MPVSIFGLILCVNMCRIPNLIIILIIFYSFNFFIDVIISLTDILANVLTFKKKNKALPSAPWQMSVLVAPPTINWGSSVSSYKAN